ncbi:MAG: hypothetical protein WBN75_15040 [Verrucomicrobiia bacterium]
MKFILLFEAFKSAKSVLLILVNAPLELSGELVSDMLLMLTAALEVLKQCKNDFRRLDAVREQA